MAQGAGRMLDSGEVGTGVLWPLEALLRNDPWCGRRPIRGADMQGI
jgi:hypothetical protein